MTNPPRTGKAGCFGSSRGENPGSPPRTPHRGNSAECGVTDRESKIWTSLKLIQWTSEFFKKKEIPNPRLDAELLLAFTLKCPRIELYTGHERKIPEKELARFRSLVERRAKREPLQYIVGETEFWGLKIWVTPDVLIPRPETELLVEEAIKILSHDDNERGGERRIHSARAPGTSDPRRGMTDGGLGGRAGSPPAIMDIGTGSGCIAIALAKQLSKARIVATDLSEEALQVARENARTNEVEEQMEFLLSDIAPWKRFQAEGRSFDLIVSNPPYIATNEFASLQPEVRDFEPRKALDGGHDGLEVIKKILRESPPFLKPGGALLLEIGEGHSKALRGIGEFKKDLNGIDRFLILKKK